MMSQHHRIKGGAADKVYQVQRFPWERGASVGGLFNFQDLLHAQDSVYTKGKEKAEEAQEVSCKRSG